MLTFSIEEWALHERYHNSQLFTATQIFYVLWKAKALQLFEVFVIEKKSHDQNNMNWLMETILYDFF